MWYIENEYKVKIGGNTYINCENIVECRGRSLFTIKRRENDNLLGIDIDIYDKNGKKVATVRRGSIVDGDKDRYDILYNSHLYSVIEKESNRTICEIKRRENVKDVELEVSVDMYTDSGFHFQASPTQTNFSSVKITGCTFENCKSAVCIT